MVPQSRLLNLLHYVLFDLDAVDGDCNGVVCQVLSKDEGHKPDSRLLQDPVQAKVKVHYFALRHRLLSAVLVLSGLGHCGGPFYVRCQYSHAVAGVSAYSDRIQPSRPFTHLLWLQGAARVRRANEQRCSGYITFFAVSVLAYSVVATRQPLNLW